MRLTLVLSCVLFLAGCSWINKSNKCVDMNLFPETIGNFQRGKVENGPMSASSYYKNVNTGDSVKYSVYTGLTPSGDQEGESLINTPPLKVSFREADDIYFQLFDGKNIFTASATKPQAMSDWVNAFPYEKFGFKPPALPIKIELPPAAFIKEHTNADPDVEKNAKEAGLELVKLWLVVNKIKASPVISTLDPTTIRSMVFSGTDTPSKKVIDEYMSSSGANLRSIGFRQIFIGKIAYLFPAKTAEIGAKTDKSNRNGAKSKASP